jgi:IS1 family transposase
MKWGKDREGRQRFRCRTCGKTTVDKPAAPLGTLRVEPDKAGFALRLLLEGMSIRAVRRMTGLGRNTLARVILRAGENCRRFLAANVRNVPAADVQCDELWSFVGCKERTRNLRGYGEETGDCYTFIAFDRATKLVLAHHVGRRCLEDAGDFAFKLGRAVSGRPQISTDGFTPYQTVIPMAFAWQVDQGRLVKIFGSPSQARAAAVRYSPAPIIGIEKSRVCGNPDMSRVCTSHVERQNMTIRMEIRRFTRLTNAFSKSRRYHAAMLALFFAHFNFCRKHGTVKTTPAVAAGIASEPWAIDRLLSEAARIVA